VKSAIREKDRCRARERRLTTHRQGQRQIYRAFYSCNLYKVGIADGPVAQGIEQQPSKLKVAGSNPAGVAILQTASFDFSYLADVLSSGFEMLDNFSSLLRLVTAI
jgi:hypothetical protein